MMTHDQGTQQLMTREQECMMSSTMMTSCALAREWKWAFIRKHMASGFILSRGLAHRCMYISKVFHYPKL